MRATQHGQAVAAAVTDGLLVLAGPTGRRHLELAGIVFGDAFAISEPAAFTVSEAIATLQCAAVREDRWSPLPGLESTGRLGLQLPPQIGGELQLLVGDALPMQMQAQTPDGRDVPITFDALMAGRGSDSPPADSWFDGGRRAIGRR